MMQRLLIACAACGIVMAQTPGGVPSGTGTVYRCATGNRPASFR